LNFFGHVIFSLAEFFIYKKYAIHLTTKVADILA